MSLLPCSSCPWRVDQDAAAVARVQPPLKASNLKRMVGSKDGLRPVMQCHNTADQSPQICKGYLASTQGLRNINVRILLAERKVPNPATVNVACKDAGIALHMDYSAVLKKLPRSR